ncbi:nucleoside recognition domain-containing protein, partial [uncultured Fenollaria sp.]|uniref:nucleoside recognition domain-containing protein n=1 Tax=uncultured Fenollaria sp. TaxID=1686315 RepID=UPI0025F3B4F1
FRLEWLDGDIENSMLATIGSYLRYIFIPLGFGDSWAPAVATITGLVAKEVVVATFASVGAKVPIYFSQVTAFAFIIFTMFAAPCFAAIGAMRRELGNKKDTWFTIIFQTGLAYVLAFIVNVLGNLIFKGTELVKKVPLDYEAAEEASEAVDVQGNLILYVLAGLVVVAVVGAIIARIEQRQKYKKVA